MKVPIHWKAHHRALNYCSPLLPTSSQMLREQTVSPSPTLRVSLTQLLVPRTQESGNPGGTGETLLRAHVTGRGTDRRFPRYQLRALQFDFQTSPGVVVNSDPSTWGRLGMTVSSRPARIMVAVTLLTRPGGNQGM